jgi:post-segregation antitoxin (ccd killing protein)
VRLNISVPDELAGRVRELKLPVSAICQRALAEAVSRQCEDEGGPPARAREIAAMLADFADSMDRGTACTLRLPGT